MIQRLDFLYQVGRLARFSFTDMNCCSTAALVIMIHEIIHNHPMYHSSIEIAIRAMTYMATGCENAKQGLNLLRLLQPVFAAGQDKLVRRDVESSSTVRTTIGSAVGYQEWERWLATNAGGSNSHDAIQSSTEAFTPSNAERPSQEQSDAFEKQCETSDRAFQWMNEHMNMSEQGVYMSVGAQMPRAALDNILDIQTAFDAAWPDILDALGLNGFDDFTFSNLQT